MANARTTATKMAELFGSVHKTAAQRDNTESDERERFGNAQNSNTTETNSTPVPSNKRTQRRCGRGQQQVAIQYTRKGV